MSAEMRSVVLNGEHEIIIPVHRADRPDWYTEQGWEKPRLSALKEVITGQQDPVVYYVGAEEGEMPALCQMWGAEVVLFEPNPRVWPNIKAIWDANSLTTPRMIVVGFASDHTDQHPPRLTPGSGVRWDEWPDCADGEVIGDHGFAELYQEADRFVQVAIDDAVDWSRLAPTVITFDCEGSEWQVCKGAEQTIEQHRPVIVASIHPEFMFHQFDQYSRDFRNWIRGRGYDEQILEYEHELHVLYTPS